MVIILPDNVADWLAPGIVPFPCCLQALVWTILNCYFSYVKTEQILAISCGLTCSCIICIIFSLHFFLAEFFKPFVHLRKTDHLISITYTSTNWVPSCNVSARGKELQSLHAVELLLLPQDSSQTLCDHRPSDTAPGWGPRVNPD